jgi:UDP-N-acetylmuramoyl-tripeptide--D-alanyl-D-alanine ligase
MPCVRAAWRPARIARRERGRERSGAAGPAAAVAGILVRAWDAQRIARAAGAELVRDRADADEPPRSSPEPGPRGATIDSRDIAPGDLFVGLAGERVDGGAYAAASLAAGAWGALVAPAHARALAGEALPGAVLAHPDPLAGLQALARAWREELGRRGAKVVAVTGSTGKTSTKDILAALLGGHLRTVSSPQNLNTEIGLPLAILGAPAGTQALVLEMAMRGPGQIAELTAIAAPDVGVILNVGPAHLELLGSIEAIAAAKAELIDGLKAGTTVVVPAGEPLLEGHLRSDLRTLSFGAGGDVELAGQGDDGTVEIRHGERRITLSPSFRGAHTLQHLLAAVAAASALGVFHEGPLEVRFSGLRGERRTLPGGVLLIDDCYNANPMSMRAAIDELAETGAARRVAVLGDMLELGADAPRFHREVGEHAAARGIELLVTVGPLAAGIRDGYEGEAHSVADAPAAAELLTGLLRDGDAVLVKGSRGVGLERVAESLLAPAGGSRWQDAGERPAGLVGERPVVPGGRPGRR